MKKMLITGASGFLGSRIAQFYKEKYEILAPTHGELDITEEESVLSYFAYHKPDMVVHCAAVSDTGACEREPERAWKVNVIGTENIVKGAKSVDAVCVCCSSDQVYCGVPAEGANKEDQEVNPINVYGKQKLYAEQSCMEIYDKSVHLRLAWMYDADDEKRMDFIKQLRACVSKEIAFSPMDRRGITDVWEVVKNIEPALELPGGVYNFGASNERSTYETVRSIFAQKQVDSVHVKCMENANPRNLTMDQEKLNRHGIYFSTTVEGVLKVF